MIVGHVFGKLLNTVAEELKLFSTEDAAMPCNQLSEHITSDRIGDVEAFGRILRKRDCDLDGRAFVDL